LADLQAEPTSREKILDVAEALFARRGFAGVGLREVAQEVGLGKSSLFHHFASGKQQLYNEVLIRVQSRNHERTSLTLRPEGSPTLRLERLSHVLVDVLAEHPTTARLLLRAIFEADPLPQLSGEGQGAEATAESAACDSVLEKIIVSFHKLLAEGIAIGEFREVSIPDTTTSVIGAAVFHFASDEFGESLLGTSPFTAEAVARRRREVESFFRHALVREQEGAPRG